MSRIIIFLFFITINCYSQKPFESFQKGDTLIEIKTYENLNSLREFKKIHNIEFYKEFNLTSKILKEEGKFDKDGDWFGIRKIYSEQGKLIKEINYDNNQIKFFNNYYEPFEENFMIVEQKAEYLLKEKLGIIFFQKYIIQNTNHSYYYGKNMSNNWFDVAESKPTEFTMSYDIKWNNECHELFYFKMDSLGNFYDKNAVEPISNYQNKEIITKETAEKIALKNGLTEKEKPFEYNFVLEPNKNNALHINIFGKPYKTVREGNTIKDSFLLLTVDAFTGKVVNTEKKTYYGIID